MLETNQTILAKQKTFHLSLQKHYSSTRIQIFSSIMADWRNIVIGDVVEILNENTAHQKQLDKVLPFLGF